MSLDESFFAETTLEALILDADPSDVDLLPEVPRFLHARSAALNPPMTFSTQRPKPQPQPQAPLTRSFQIGVVRNGELRMAFPKTG